MLERNERKTQVRNTNVVGDNKTDLLHLLCTNSNKFKVQRIRQF